MIDHTAQNKLALLGTWGGLDDRRALRVSEAIQARGGWASWWSFPIREEFLSDLNEGPFYLYLNTGHAHIAYRMLIDGFKSSRGNDGLETPWPALTDLQLQGKTRIGAKTSEVFKTWLRAVHLERLPEPLSLDAFAPAHGVPRNALLNQSSFGYAYPPAHNKPAIASDIQSELETFMGLYVRSRPEERFGKEATAYQMMEKLEVSFATLPALSSRETVSVQGSVGQGNWVGVPWVAFLDSRETDSTQDGVYPVLLFRPDMSGVFVTLNQGVTRPLNTLGRAEGRRFLRERIEAIRPRGAAMRHHSFALDDNIDLRATSGVGRNYADATIGYKFYARGAVPTATDINADIEAILIDYERYLAVKQPAKPPSVEELEDASTVAPVPPDMSLPRIVDDFADALQESGLTLGAAHHDNVSAFIASLATKRFVILTGLSGSGKTQIAMRFGEWLGPNRSRLIPVRPDWSGAEAIFGYEDALRESYEGRRAWHVPDTLKLILEAASDTETPYLLILDEMNLAHVERYFADALSGIESDMPVIPNLRREADGQWRIPQGAPELVPLPTNVFIVGTVNVDETTYMFSPKVLDRANTIEFRVATDALGVRARPIRCRSGPPKLVAGFLSLARDIEWLASNAAPYAAGLHEKLKQLHMLLTTEGFEFGHRTYYEAMRFGDLIAPVVGDDLLTALDFQVLQKMLPRLHGARRRLEPVLCELGRFCFDPNSTRESAPFDPLADRGQSPALPRSFAKIRRMTSMLRANQFASFAE
jgi:5-methylcytosine-specific restriction protein B